MGLALESSISLIREGGPISILSTFDVSAIVWISCVGGVILIADEKADKIRRADIVLGTALLVPIVLPIGGLSWLAVTILSLYVILFTDAPSSRRRGAMILLAVTVPMLWSPLLFRYFANFILEIDASLVSVLLDTHRSGNLVRFIDESGSLAILPYCSSLHNVSLAILSWVGINQWLARRACVTDWQWVFVAALAVIAVNVTRMSLMGFSINYYHAVHSFWGDTIVNLIILFTIVGICLVGVRRELFVRA